MNITLTPVLRRLLEVGGLGLSDHLWLLDWGWSWLGLEYWGLLEASLGRAGAGGRSAVGSLAWAFTFLVTSAAFTPSTLTRTE